MLTVPPLRLWPWTPFIEQVRISATRCVSVRRASKGRCEMFQDVHQWKAIRRRVLEERQSMRAIQRETRLHWKTIRKILDHAEPPGYRQKRARAKPMIGPFLGALHQIVEDDNRAHKLRRRSTRQIYNLLREQGYTGSYSSVRDYLAEKRLCVVDRGTVMSDLVDRPLRESKHLDEVSFNFPNRESPLSEAFPRFRKLRTTTSGCLGGCCNGCCRYPPPTSPRTT